MSDDPAHTSPALDDVAQQFDTWRNNRSKRERIPQHLWKAAADLCSSHPITHVCKRLRLSYPKLKAQLGDTSRMSLQFVQLDAQCVADSWRICCQRSDGARLTMSSHGPLPDIGDIVHRFAS